jgi:hypothetical protein
MAQTQIGTKITTIALELLKENPDGIRYSELVRLISDADPALKINTVHGNVWNLDARFPTKVFKPSRGLFRLAEFSDKETGELKEELIPKFDKKIKEEDFYVPFADWLVNDLEDCTKAIGLGGNLFKEILTLTKQDSLATIEPSETEHFRWSQNSTIQPAVMNAALIVTLM